MSASCPYCGAKLNLGIRFCVVCGRHVTTESMGKFGGLRGGFRPADITRRLDELISVSRFKKSRRSYQLERGTRWAFVNTIYLLVATGLFYSAIQYSLELMFPGKFHHTRIPVSEIVSFLQTKHKELTSPSIVDGSKEPAEQDKQAAKDEKKPEKPKKASAKKQTKKSKKKKKKRKRRRRRRRKSSK